MVSTEKRLEAKIDHTDARMSEMEKRINGRFSVMEGKFDQVLSKVHGIQVLMEEQRSENRVVLDGLKSFIERQDRMEDEHKDFRHTLQLLVSAKLPPLNAP